jgi:hypothetical protein
MREAIEPVLRGGMWAVECEELDRGATSLEKPAQGRAPKKRCASVASTVGLKHAKRMSWVST